MNAPSEAQTPNPAAAALKTTAPAPNQAQIGGRGRTASRATPVSGQGGKDQATVSGLSSMVRSASPAASALVGAAGPQARNIAPAAAGKPAGTSAGQSLTGQGELVQQMVQQARLVTRNGQTQEIRIDLRPPDLGSMRLTLSLEHGQLQARVQVDSPAAQEALQRLGPQVREALAQDGMNLQRFDVDLRQGNQDPSGTGDANAGNSRQGGQAGGAASLFDGSSGGLAAGASDASSPQATSERQGAASAGLMDYVV